MARMTHFHGILKRDLFKRITFLRTFLSAKDVLADAAAQDYHWRDRIWTPPSYNRHSASLTVNERAVVSRSQGS